MIKTILVPFDGSESSLSALSIGTSLAGLTDAMLIGLFVIDENRLTRVSFPTLLFGSLGLQPLVPSPLPPDEATKAIEVAERECSELRKLFTSACANAGVTGQFLYSYAEPASAIVAASRTVDLVVTGNRGIHSGVPGKHPGETMETLLRQTTRPVIVVPNEPLGESAMVVAYDGTQAASRTLSAAAEIALTMQLRDLHLLTVDDGHVDVDAVQEEAIRYLLPYQFPITRIVCKGSPGEVIRSYLEEVDPSIVAIGAFGQNRLAERIFGSTTSHVLGQMQTAVLLGA